MGTGPPGPVTNRKQEPNGEKRTYLGLGQGGHFLPQPSFVCLDKTMALLHLQVSSQNLTILSRQTKLVWSGRK